MLDMLASVDNTGNVALTPFATSNANASIPSGDGQTTMGVPRSATKGEATLVMWGVSGIVSVGVIKEALLQSQDQIDPTNAVDWLPKATSLIGTFAETTQLKFLGSQRIIKYSNTVATLTSAFYLDYYADNGKRGVGPGTLFPDSQVQFKQAFGALTAQKWGSVAVQPSINPPEGVYEILGCWVDGLTEAGYIKFQHADFGTYQPGFPVIDDISTTLIRSTLPGNVLNLISAYEGFQFARLSDILKRPVCPRFKIGANSTGLQAWCLDNTADTPTIIVNLNRVGT